MNYLMKFLKKINQNLKKRSKINTNEIIEKKEDLNNFIWLKNKNYSCRYGSFMLIYALTIKNLVIKLNYNSEITNIYNELSDKILIMDKNQLENGIWDLISNIKNTKYDFSIKGFKQSYAISQLIGPLNKNNFFCFKYKSQFYCYNYLYQENFHNYVGPIIEINNEDLKNNLSECLYQRFRNKSMLCKKCGYLDGKIITNYETCSETIIKVENPNV